MGAESGIAWTDDTFNPWWGCMKVSPGCDNCYAEALDRRTGQDHWGPRATYRTFADKYWNGPVRWNRLAAEAGVRRRVFCASMADVFDNRGPADVRARLWDLVRATPHLDWLMLTKRPQNIVGMLPPEWGEGWANVWIGTTAENQTEADRRVPHLLRAPAAVRFLSCEPLIGPVNLRRIALGGDIFLDALTGFHEATVEGPRGPDGDMRSLLDRIPALPPVTAAVDWVIVGGESGQGARPYYPAWVRHLRAQAEAVGTAFFHKQVGSRRDGWVGVTGKGENPAEWPADLRVREFPAAPAALAAVPA